LRRFLLSGQGWPYVLVPFIPIAILLDAVHASPSLVFFASALGVVPTAALMGKATEELAARSGPGIGGLLNVTFGNAPELIIALFALNAGLQEVVKASIIGSVLGNLLLVMGAAMLVGGWGRERQKFVAEAASAQATLLLLATVALILPALFLLSKGGALPQLGQEATHFSSDIEKMSFGVSIVLLLSYGAGLWFSLKTHKDVFNPEVHDAEAAHAAWSVKRSVAMLAIAGVAVGFMSEILVGSIEEASKGIGLSPFFVSLIIVAIVGNAAEHWVAVYFAARDKVDLSIAIAVGSSAQIALFVMPVLVILSFVLGPFPLALEFSGLEIGAILLAVLIAAHVTQEGESTWFEGVQLLAVYVVLAVVFFFV
jgi:Ca2+:H+ antiporter